jgi:hypothetical protein
MQQRRDRSDCTWAEAFSMAFFSDWAAWVILLVDFRDDTQIA